MQYSKSFATALLKWYDRQGRKSLPWRQNITPYRAWIAEIMLQQTQVQTVIPYYQRFMERFPSLDDLANAAEEEVLTYWSGLGYYARGRNLRHAARQLVKQHQGIFPDNLTDLQALPGVGRSTAGAILAIAFNKKAAILDGNVKRILARLHTVSGVTASAQTAKQLWALAEHYTPAQRTADYTQAIMDLGATVCTRSKPQCPSCPLTTYCQAYQQHKVSEFPTAKPRKIIPSRAINLLIFYDVAQHAVLMEKRPPVGIWGGLWSFPECPADSNVLDWCRQHYAYSIANMTPLTSFIHVFSHFQLHITPICIQYHSTSSHVMDAGERIWYNLKNLTPMGFATPIQRLLQQLGSVDVVRAPQTP